MKDTILVKLALTVTAFSMGGTLLLAYWLLYPTTVIEITQPPRVVTWHPVAGEPLEYSFGYCKNSRYDDVHALVEHEMIQGDMVYAFPVTAGRLEPGCHSIVVDLGTVSTLHFPAGDYTIQVTRSYDVNPLRRVTVTARSAPFRIYDK
jgi:hypothetical protein